MRCMFLVAAVLLASSLPAQTTGVPNQNYLRLHALGSFEGPTSCVAAPFVLPAGVFIGFEIQASRCGLPVAVLFNSCACDPGFFPFSSSCASPHTLDLNTTPPCFTGAVLGQTGLLRSFFFAGPLPACPVGFGFSVQGLIYDPACGGLLLTQAYDIQCR